MNRRRKPKESRALLVLRRNLWHIQNPNGGFYPVRFIDPPGRRWASKRTIRMPDSFLPLEIGSIEEFRFVGSL